MTTSAVSRLRQHQRVTPLAARLAAMGLGDPAALCTVHAPLTGSLALTKGAGSITHSRADTFAPTTTDHEGIVRVCRQGEARFWGLRRVENLLASSENFSTWTNENAGTGAARVAALATTDTPPSGAATCWRVNFNRGAGNTSADYSGMYASISMPGANRSMRLSVYVKAAYTSDVGRDIAIKGDGAAYTLVTLTADWVRVQAPGLSASASTYVEIINRGTVTTSNDVTVLLAAAQVEDVTNQSDTSAGEYVSTGVASAPAYHGANVDGVRYYATTQAGAAIVGGGLLVEGSAQNLLGSTDMTSGTWYGICSASNDGTYAAGVAMCKITKTTTSSSENRYCWANGASNLSAGWYACKLLLLASANCTRASVEIYGNTSGDGADANAVNTIISGPGTLTRLYGSLFTVTGLSTTTPTVIECKRNLTVSEPLRLFFYPDLHSSTTSGKAIYAAVGNLEAGSICTSRIPTSGSMLTRPADSVTLPTSGNLGAEWGAMSATVTLPSIAATDTVRVVLNLTGQAAWPLYVYDAGSAAWATVNMWGSIKSVSIGARTAGAAFNCATAWRSGDKLRAGYGGSTSGESATAATAVALPSTVTLGAWASGNAIQGAIRDLKIYGLDLTAAQLQTVTT